jgi:hypothetical protein
MNMTGKLLTQTATGFAASPQTAVVVKSIARELALDEGQVDHVITTGIPRMVIVTADNPEIVDLLFKESRNEQRSKVKDRKMAVLEFFSIFGADGRAMNEAIAADTGAQYADVNGVMALFLPTFVDAIEEEAVKDPLALRTLFRVEAQEIQAQDPGMAQTA